VRKGDRLKGKLSQRTDFGPIITILNVIAEINAIIEAQELQIEISIVQKAHMEISIAEEIQKRQNEDVWLSNSEKKNNEEKNEKNEDEKSSESFLNSSIMILNSPISASIIFSERLSTPSFSQWRTPRSSKTPSRRIRLSLCTKSHRHRCSAIPEHLSPPQTIPEANMAFLQSTFELLRQATPSKIPRRNEGLLQIRKAPASLRIIRGFRISRPSPERQE
jgi:hypothetical protein